MTGFQSNPLHVCVCVWEVTSLPGAAHSVMLSSSTNRQMGRGTPIHRVWPCVVAVCIGGTEHLFPWKHCLVQLEWFCISYNLVRTLWGLIFVAVLQCCTVWCRCFGMLWSAEQRFRPPTQWQRLQNVWTQVLACCALVYYFWSICANT